MGNRPSLGLGTQLIQHVACLSQHAARAVVDPVSAAAQSKTTMKPRSLSAIERRPPRCLHRPKERHKGWPTELWHVDDQP